MDSSVSEPSIGQKRLDNTINYKYTIFIILVLSLLNLGSVLFDNDPPLLPLKNETPIDCSKIVVSDCAKIGEKIFYQLRAKQLKYYPQQSILNMITVIAATDSALVKYNYTAFNNQTSDLTYLTFSVAHSLQGHTNFAVKCHAIPLRRDEFEIQAPESHLQGYSRLLAPDNYSARFKNVCFNNGSIEYFSHDESKFEPLVSSFDRRISIDAQYHSMNKRITKNSYQNITKPTFIVTSNPKQGYQKILDVILPIIKAKYNNENYQILFEESQKELRNELKPMLNNQHLISDRPMCFADLAFGLTMGSNQYNQKGVQLEPYAKAAKHLESMLDIDSYAVIDSMRLFSKKLIVPRRIVLDTYSESLSLALEGIFENISIEVINDTDPLDKIADTVSEAEYFISGNPQTLAYAVFMNPWGTLVEIAADGFESLRVGKRWADMAGINYTSLDSHNLIYRKTLTVKEYMNKLFLGELQYKPVNTADLKKFIMFRNMDSAVVSTNVKS